MLQSTQTQKPVTEPPLPASSRALVQHLSARWPMAEIVVGRYNVLAKVNGRTVDHATFPTGMDC